MSELDWKALLKPAPKPETPVAEPVTIKGVNLYEIGNSIRLAGAIYADVGHVYLCLLPGEDLLEQHPRRGIVQVTDLPEHQGDHIVGTDIEILDMDLDEWELFIRQTDLLEAEVLTRSKDGKLAKAIIRKSQRQISQDVSWAVFKRDGYHCRYCGKDGIPMTVDHLVLWEHGGPSIETNLVSACRKCNKARGNMQYHDWLQHSYYRRVSGGLSPTQVLANYELTATLDAIPRQHQRSR